MVEAENFNSVIQLYIEALGQKVNSKKSEIFFLNTKIGVEDQICNLMGYKKGQFSCKYLGI